jgi:hypothetical protein
MAVKYPLPAIAILVALPCLAQAPPTVAGKALPKVTGPLAGSRALGDGSREFGDSRMEREMRGAGRRSPLPCVAVPAGDVTIEHAVSQPAGWMTYRVDAAPWETVKARLRGGHEAWFAVKVVNKWGELEEGMLQNRIHTGNPEGSFLNRTGKTRTVFFVVDTTTIFNGEEPYTLTFTREMTDPAKR